MKIPGLAAPSARARRRRVVVSARVRILGWVLLLLVAALAVSILTARSILLSRVDHDADVELAHETAKLREFAATATVPGTASGYRSVSALLTAYLRTTVVDSDEAMFSIVAGRADHRSAGNPPARLDADAAFVARAATTNEPRYGTRATAGGPVRYAVLPVRVAGDPRAAQLVVVEFTAPEREFVESLVRVLIAVGVGALAFAGALGWLIAGRVLAPVRHVRETAEQIGASDLTRRIPVRGRDDVAALAHTVNGMLARLEGAFATQRQFLDDAGHELRTPITIIRGHLELLEDDPAERAATIELVTDELDRMRRIVDDLVTLAQSERPDFVQLTRVQLTDLVVDALAKASALGQRSWALGAVAEATITADPQRLTQALLQLAANAVAHTRPGDRIELGSAADEQGVRLWVADTGSGIPAADQRRIFDRFARAGTARPTGAGLGLAIVVSIAAAHAGTVTVDSEPGHGSTFTLRLPAAATAAPTSTPSQPPRGAPWPES